MKKKRSIIANYESNNSTPGFEVLNKLSNFFNVPVGYLTSKTNSLVSKYRFKTLEQISYMAGGIRKHFIKTDSSEIVENISYKSLLSLMYYELFLDIRNGNIPNYCFECNKFYFPDIKHKCKK